MKYRLRFIIYHSLVVCAILLAAMMSVYLLYSHERKSDFRDRLAANDYEILFSHYGVDSAAKEILQNLSDHLPANLHASSVFIFNDAQQLVYQNLSEKHTAIQPELLQTIKSEGKYFFKDNDEEGAGIYYKTNNYAAYAISCSRDIKGFARLQKLADILLIITIIAIIVTAAFSYFYVLHITKPLVQLSLQMRGLNERNFKDKFILTRDDSKKDEMSLIVNNFNGMLDRLNKAFDMQKTFVHHASHELRTPLAVMLAQTESAIRKELDGEESKKVLYSLKEDLQDMIDLTNSLLLLSQYEHATAASDWPLVRLDEVLYDTVEIIKRIYRNINISIEFDELPEGEFNLSVPGNESLLRSAFRNLIKNAYQYSDDKNVRVIICFDEKNINIHFDNGGKTVNEKEQPQLFIPFFRSVNSQHKKGFGLGLSIVRRIILLHKGNIFYSVYKETTNRFTVSFPNNL